MVPKKCFARNMHGVFFFIKMCQNSTVARKCLNACWPGNCTPQGECHFFDSTFNWTASITLTPGKTTFIAVEIAAMKLLLEAETIKPVCWGIIRYVHTMNYQSAVGVGAPTNCLLCSLFRKRPFVLGFPPWWVQWSAKMISGSIISLGGYSIPNLQTLSEDLQPRCLFRVHPLQIMWIVDTTSRTSWTKLDWYKVRCSCCS